MPSVASALDLAAVGVGLSFLELKALRLSFLLGSCGSAGAVVAFALAKTLKEIQGTVALVLLYQRQVSHQVSVVTASTE